MRRKPQPRPEPVIPPAMLEQAVRSLATDKLSKTVKCSVCGTETTSQFTEPLCWVCRRLKISAWRDIEQQLPAPE